jgi:hypothetical protein
MSSETKTSPQGTIAFHEFWRWLKGHVSCILSVATPDAALYDHDTVHWQLNEDEGVAVVQLLQGKAIIGEVALESRVIDYVQVTSEGEEDCLFDCISTANGDPASVYSFTLTHGYVPDITLKRGGLVH